MTDPSQEHKAYHGVIVPMITPLTQAGDLDEPACRRVIDALVAGGVQGIFVLGTTGEGPSAPRELGARLVAVTVEHTAGRAQVYAGISSTVVNESLAAAKEYLRRGVTAVVAALPSYYRISGDEQFRYYTLLAKRVNGPILLYDIPAAVHMTIDPGVIEHLRAFPHVVGIKDSSDDSERLDALLEAYADDAGFSVLVGSTRLASHGFRRGADGFIPSAGNLNPTLCSRLYAAARIGDWALMDTLQAQVNDLQAEINVDGYIGRGIARLKAQMAQRGLCGPYMLSPLVTEE